MAKFNREKLLTEWDKLTVEEQYEELRFLKDHTQKKINRKTKTSRRTIFRTCI